MRSVVCCVLCVISSKLQVARSLTLTLTLSCLAPLAAEADPAALNLPAFPHTETHDRFRGPGHLPGDLFRRPLFLLQGGRPG